MAKRSRKKGGEEEPAHEQAPGEKTQHGDKGRKLEVAQSHDGVTRSAAASVPRSKSDEETASNHQHEGSPGANVFPRKQRLGVLSSKVHNAQFVHSSHRGCAERNGFV